MKKKASILVLMIIVLATSLPSTISADKSHRIHSPRGGVITLVITDGALKNIRIYDLKFSNSGDVFSLAAAPLPAADSIKMISINFHEGSTLVQSEYVDIGPRKTVQEVYCPESFDRLVIDYSGY